MSFVAAAAGAAVVARPLAAARLASTISSNVCVAVGAVTISGVAFGVVPFVKRRAPMDYDSQEELRQDFRKLIGLDVGGVRSDGATSVAGASGEKSWRRLTFDDLNNPWLFELFTTAARAVFAVYADATGVMTPTEFACALHKLIDITISCYGGEENEPERQAAAVRTLLERVANGAFTVIDEDGDGRIDASEFTRAVLLVLAVANGKAQGDAPILQRLAFRVVNSSGNGSVSEAELQRWVELALLHATVPESVRREPRGPWGIFGTRTLTTAALTRKWLRVADADRDGALAPSEFNGVSVQLQIHEVIRRMAKRFSF